MTVTDQQRAEWRAEARQRLADFISRGIAAYPEFTRLIVALNALDTAAEDLDIERHETSLVREARGEAMADAEFWRTRAESAESERDSLAVVLTRVGALVDSWDRDRTVWREAGLGSHTMHTARVVTALRTALALAGPSPTDEGGES